MLQEAAHRQINNREYNIVLAYISAVLVFTNAQRPGSIENITVEEYRKRKEIEPGKYIIRVMVHKTASSGPANIIFCKEMEQCLHKYNTFLRACITPQNRELSRLFLLTPTGRRCDKVTEN